MEADEKIRDNIGAITNPYFGDERLEKGFEGYIQFNLTVIKNHIANLGTSTVLVTLNYPLCVKFAAVNSMISFVKLAAMSLFAVLITNSMIILPMKVF